MPAAVVTLTLEEARQLLRAEGKCESTLSMPDVAARCGVCIRTVQKWIRSGELKAVKPNGGRIYILLDDLHDFDRRHYVTATDEKGSSTGSSLPSDEVYQKSLSTHTKRKYIDK